VLDQARGSDYTIWAVALLLYVCDAAKLLSPREVLLVEAGRGRLATAFSDNPFTITGRVLVFGPLLFPQRGIFVAPWGRTWIDAAPLNAMLASLQQFRGSLLVARIFSAWGFVLLFVLGPALTWALGVSAAVMYTAAVLYPTVGATIIAIWWQRHELRLSASRAAWLSVEILACPAFLPNLVRKITAPHRVEIDGAQIIVATASADIKGGFLERLESRTQELIEESSDDVALQQELRSYLVTLRCSRCPC
jgi:hypothetical protein